MATPKIVRSVIAGFLLVVFAFGITPKRTLHNLLANHKDGSAKTWSGHTSGTELSKSTFNCQCDNLVCESSFVAESFFQYTSVNGLFAGYLSSAVSSRVSATSFSYGLRGPPVASHFFA